MEFRQLQYFLTTVQAGSFSKAAEILFITQPALSRIVGRLEAELEFSLFIRHRSGLELTPQGKIMYESVQQMMMTLEQSIREARQAAGVGGGGISMSCAFEDFDNRIIFEFQQNYPEIHTSFSILPPVDAVRQVVDGSADLAIVPKQETLSDTVRWIPMIREEMLLSTGREHPLAGRQVINPSELNGLSVVSNDVVFDEDTLRRICAGAGIEMRFVFRGNDHHQVGALKYLMNTVLFMPCNALLGSYPRQPGTEERFGEPISPARVIPPIFQREIGMIHRKNYTLRPAELELIASITAHYTALDEMNQAYLMEHYPNRIAEEGHVPSGV